MQRLILRRLEESARLIGAIAGSKMPEIAQMAEIVTAAYRSGKKVVLCGNGGSAADAQHIAAELIGRFYLDRSALPAIALNADTSVITSLGNDLGFAQVFRRQVEALVNKGDVLIVLSTSGKSLNIVEAMKAAVAKGAVTVALTGAGGGQMTTLAKLLIDVPSEDTPRIQQAHITIAHIVCELVEEALAGPGHSAAGDGR
ncbi:MAG: SIS domain-containing protein [Chloroflexota bacterium]